MSHTAKLAAGEGRWGGLGGHEYGPGQTKRAGVYYYAHSQLSAARAKGGLLGGVWPLALARGPQLYVKRRLSPTDTRTTTRTHKPKPPPCSPPKGEHFHRFLCPLTDPPPG